MSELNRRALVSGLGLAFGLPVLGLSLPAEARTPARSLNWVPAWYAAPEPSGSEAKAQDLTFRQIVRLSAGGAAVRIRLSNAYGTEALRIDEVRLAKRAGDTRIDSAGQQAVTFNGLPSVSIPPGAYVLSDLMPLSLTAHSDLVISLYVKGPAALTTVHDNQRAPFFIATGNRTADMQLPTDKPDVGIGNAFPWLSGVEVLATGATRAVIAFGDSITDGYGITQDQGKPWPDVLSRRFAGAGLPLSVVNAGISGNRLLNNGTWSRFGSAGLARFDRDVLAQPNVGAVVLMIGINDLGHAAGPSSPGFASLDDLTGGLAQIAARARGHGIRVYAATLTPFRGTTFDGFYSDEKETRRKAINGWIRGSDLFDGVFDFDKALEDPARPGWLLPAYDVGDHLHPNDTGAAKMAQTVPLSAFNWARPRRR